MSRKKKKKPKKPMIRQKSTCISCGKVRKGAHARGCFPKRGTREIWDDVRVYAVEGADELIKSKEVHE